MRYVARVNRFLVVGISGLQINHNSSESLKAWSLLVLKQAVGGGDLWWIQFAYIHKLIEPAELARSWGNGCACHEVIQCHADNDIGT